MTDLRKYVALTEFNLFVLSSLQVPGKSCFKAPKVSLDKFFTHWNVHFCLFCTKKWIWAISFRKRVWKSPNFIDLYCIHFRYQGKLFWSSKSPVGRLFLTLIYLILLILYKKLILNDHNFRKWAWHFLNFIHLCCLHCEY